MSNLVPSHPQHPVAYEPGRDPSFDAQASSGEGAADVRELFALVRRNLLLILAVAVATTAVAAYLAVKQPTRYAATAAVRIADVRRSLTGGIEEQAMERFTGSMTDPVLSQIEVLRSRTLIGRAVDASGQRLRPVGFSSSFLEGASTSPEAPADTLQLTFGADGYRVRGGAEELSAAYGVPVTTRGVRFAVRARPEVAEGALVVVARDAAINGVLAHLTTRQRERTDVIDLRYEHGDPVAAQATLNSLATTFQAVNAERAREQSRRRRIFLEEQLEATDSLLALAQLDLSRFREREVAFSTRDRFIAQQQALMTLDMRIEELAAERNVYRSLLASLPARGADPAALRAVVSNPSLASNPAIAQLNTQLIRYENTRDSIFGGSNPLASTHPDAQRLEAMLATTAARISETLRSHVSNADVRIAALNDLRTRNSAAIQSMPDTEAQEVRLAQTVVTTQAMSDQLRQEFQRARISEAVEAGQVEVLDAAGPARPLPSRRMLTIMLGLIAGLVLGGGAAVVREQLNTSLRRREDVERFLGVASLAVIPRIQLSTARTLPVPGRNGTRAAVGPDGVEETLVAALRSRSSGAEAYRTLRTNLIFSQAVQKLRVVAVTSAGPGEGKSTTSANLATVFAQQGLRVLLVDCDLRRPRLHEIFGCPKEPGFTQYLLGHGSLEELARETPVANLRLLAAGTLPPNPAELLGSPRAREAVRLMSDQFDMVIIDTPPVLLASDAAILGSLVDGMLLVVRAARTSRHAANQAVRQLETVGANLLGVVLNDPEAKLPRYEGYYGYGYGYDSYYGETEEEARSVPAGTH